MQVVNEGFAIATEHFNEKAGEEQRGSREGAASVEIGSKGVADPLLLRIYPVFSPYISRIYPVWKALTKHSRAIERTGMMR